MRTKKKLVAIFLPLPLVLFYFVFRSPGVTSFYPLTLVVNCWKVHSHAICNTIIASLNSQIHYLTPSYGHIHNKNDVIFFHYGLSYYIEYIFLHKNLEIIKEFYKTRNTNSLSMESFRFLYLDFESNYESLYLRAVSFYATISTLAIVDSSEK